MAAFLGLEQGEDKESAEFETNEDREVEHEGRYDRKGCVVARVNIAAFPVERTNGGDGGQHVAGMRHRGVGKHALWVG